MFMEEKHLKKSVSTLRSPSFRLFWSVFNTSTTEPLLIPTDGSWDHRLCRTRSQPFGQRVRPVFIALGEGGRGGGATILTALCRRRSKSQKHAVMESHRSASAIIPQPVCSLITRRLMDSSPAWVWCFWGFFSFVFANAAMSLEKKKNLISFRRKSQISAWMKIHYYHMLHCCCNCKM